MGCRFEKVSSFKVSGYRFQVFEIAINIDIVIAIDIDIAIAKFYIKPYLCTLKLIVCNFQNKKSLEEKNFKLCVT